MSGQLIKDDKNVFRDSGRKISRTDLGTWVPVGLLGLVKKITFVLIGDSVEDTLNIQGMIRVFYAYIDLHHFEKIEYGKNRRWNTRLRHFR